MDTLAQIPDGVFDDLMEKSYDLGAELWITSCKLPALTTFIINKML